MRGIYVLLAIVLMAVWLVVGGVSATVVDGNTYNYVKSSVFHADNNQYTTIRYTIHNVVGVNTSTDLWLGGNIKANFSDIRFTDGSGAILPAYLNVKNDTMAEILVNSTITATTGTTINTLYNSTSGQSNWTTFPGLKTVTTNPYYSQDEWRNYTYDGTTEVPVSVAFQDLFGGDTASRYANASATTGLNWVAATPAKEVVSGGVFTLSSDSDVALSARLKSYKFAGGQIEYSFDHNGDGGGITAKDGLWLAMQDFSNSYRITIGDDYAGNENVSISNITAGTMTVMNVTDISALYTHSSKTWVKTKFEETTGSVWVWVRDDAGSYTAAPQIIAQNKLASNWSYGYTGFYSTVGTAGAGNLNTNYDDLTINAESILEYTNIPIGGGRYKPMLRGAQIREYWDGTNEVACTRELHDFNFDTVAELTQVYRTWTVDTASGTLVPSSTNGLVGVKNKYGSGVAAERFTFTSKTTAYTNYLLFGWDGTSNGAGSPYNSYYAQVIASTGILSLAKYDGSGTVTILSSASAVTLSINTPYYIGYYWNQSTGSMTAYLFDGNGGVLSSTTTTDATYSASNYIGMKYSTATTINELQINALSADSTDGVSATLGGVPHGARYDTNEYTGLAFTDSTSPNNYNVTLPSLTTATVDPATMQLVFTNTAGTGFSNQTAAISRPLTIIGTSTALGFGNENLQTTVAKGNDYLVYSNFTNWIGTQYDQRDGTVFFNPAVYPSAYNTVTVPQIIAQFRPAGPTTIWSPPGLAYRDASTNNPTAWNWSFGDGTFSTKKNPVHYWSPGTYNVSLNASNAYVYATNSTTVKVY
jgi:hypothetical protein